MARTSRPIVAFMQITIFIATFQNSYGAYLGKFLGKLTELHHGVSGEVYAIDARTLHLKDFTYDGQGPAAYFYAGNSRVPGTGGFRLRDEKGNPEVIRRYRKESVTLTLPEGKTLNSIKWFSVWCEEFTVNFGDVKIPRNFDYPRPRKIDALKGVHSISSDNIVVVDAQTLLIPNLSYDGEAPDAKFWVGAGAKPSPQGVRVPDENGKEIPLRRYDQKTVVLTLPGDITIFDIDYFGIWCEAFTVDFGHIVIPKNLNVPPSLKMLGISPQKLPRGFNNKSEIPRRQAQLVGGQVEATTFRPTHIFRQITTRPVFTERHDELRSGNPPINRHELVNRGIYDRSSFSGNPNLINQPQFNQNQALQSSVEQRFFFGQPNSQSLPHQPDNVNRGLILHPQQQVQVHQVIFSEPKQHQIAGEKQQQQQFLEQPRPGRPFSNEQQQFEQRQLQLRHLQLLQQQLSEQQRHQTSHRNNNNRNTYVTPQFINGELQREQNRQHNTFVENTDRHDQDQLKEQLNRQFSRFILPNNQPNRGFR